MPQVDASFAHIADVNISGFADLSVPGGEQGATIKVHNNTFRVKVGADGNVSVKFKGNSLFNLLRTRTKSRLAEQLRTQVEAWRAASAKPDEGALRQTIGSSTDRAFGEVFGPDPRTGEISAGGTEVAVYGFSEIRGANAESAQKHNISYAMIDDYNRGIGIRPEGLSLKGIGERIRHIREGNLPVIPTENGIKDPEKLKAWAQFLARPENLRKIDIMGRLKEYLAVAGKPSKGDKQMTGWKGEFARLGADKAMQAFIRKNLPGGNLSFEVDDEEGEQVQVPVTDRHIKMLSDALIHLVKQDPPDLSIPSVNAAFEEAARKAGIEVGHQELSEFSIMLDAVAASAFFRQTSKLGLEFFKERRTPVMFYWTNHQGQTIGEGNRALTNKWWKNPSESVHKHYGASITYSEMRHVLKMQQAEMSGMKKLDDIDPLVLMKITGKSV